MTYRQPAEHPKILEWVDNAPRSTKESAWEPIMAEVRRKTGGKWAKVARGDTNPSSAWLRRTWPDIEIIAPKGSDHLWLRVKTDKGGDLPPPLEMAEFPPPDRDAT